MVQTSEETRGYVEDGVRLCRSGQWNKGLPVLASAIENRAVGESVPGVAYSFLGYGVARFQGKHRDGMRLCEHAMKLQYYEADNHWNLARLHLLASNRQAAVTALEGGLQLDPDHDGLLALAKEIGTRKPPVIRFLGRGHPLNRWLGRMRHSWSGKPAAGVSRTGR